MARNINIEKTVRNGTAAAYRRLSARLDSNDALMALLESHRARVRALFDGVPSEEVVLALFYEVAALCVTNERLSN